MNIFDFITQDITHGVIIIFTCCLIVVIACLFDMWTAIEAAKTRKERISSHSLRKTVTKVIDYLRIVFFALLIDILGLFFPWYSIPYCVILATLGILLIEGRSFIENYRKKKSAAAEIVDAIKEIIDCKDKVSAENIISMIYENQKKYKDENEQ